MTSAARQRAASTSFRSGSELWWSYRLARDLSLRIALEFTRGSGFANADRCQAMRAGEGVANGEAGASTRRWTSDDSVVLLHLGLHDRTADGHSIGFAGVVGIAADTAVEFGSTKGDLLAALVLRCVKEQCAEFALEVSSGWCVHGVGIRELWAR